MNKIVLVHRKPERQIHLLNGTLIMDLARLQDELIKRCWLPIPWHYSFWHSASKEFEFLYKTSIFDDVLIKIKSLPEKTQNQAVNNWYNFWSDIGLKYIFSTHPVAGKNENSLDNLIFANLNNTHFTIHQHIFPYKFAKTLNYALRHSEELLYWFYRKRDHKRGDEVQNKIFLILYERNGDHWKLKSQLLWLRKIVDDYLNQFELQKMKRLHLKENKVCYADVLWCIKEEFALK